MPATPTSATFDDLAPELVHHILAFLPSWTRYSYRHPGVDLETIQTIGACRQTCKYLNGVTRPFLFRHVSLGCFTIRTPQRSLERITEFLHMLDQDPSIASNVHTFWLYGCQSAQDENSLQVRLHNQLWNTPQLPRILNRLTSVKMFALEWVHITALISMPRWGTLGEEMEGAIRKLVSMPSITSLRFTNVTGLPMDLITSCPNLQHLTVRNIDDRTAPYIPPTVDSAPPGQHEAEWKIKSITATMCSQQLLSLHPVVEERLSVMYYDPLYLNNILKRSKDLKDLTIILNDTRHNLYSNTLYPRLHSYKSLTTLRLQSDTQTQTALNTPLINSIISLLTIQFPDPSPGITCFHIQASGWNDPGYHFESPESTVPAEWRRLETSIHTLFPALRRLVITLDTLSLRGGERFRNFIQWAWPTLTQLGSLRFVLRFESSSGWRHRKEINI